MAQCWHAALTQDVEEAAAAFAKEAASQGLITREADLKKGGNRAAAVIPVTAEAQSQPQPAQEEAEPATDMEAAGSRAQPTGWCNQYAVLQWRALQAYSRNPANVAGANPIFLRCHLPCVACPLHAWLQAPNSGQRMFQPANVCAFLCPTGRTLMAVFIGVIGGLVFFKRAAGQNGIAQDISAIFFATLVLALVPFTYMCATIKPPSMFDLVACHNSG